MDDKKTVFKEVCEDSLSFFVKHFFKELEPETKYMHNWHIDVLCAHAEAVYYGKIKNLDVNIPPRTIKSLIFNVFFPCWIWTKDPTFKILSASHSYDLSVGFNINRRFLVNSQTYQALWPIKIMPDQNTKQKFKNTSNGFMASVSVDGSVTGKGADILIVDDSIDAKDAPSEAKRNAANSWYKLSFHNRLQDKRNPRRINVQQRLHQNDLSGFLRSTYNFEHLVIPMQKKDNQIQTSLNWVDPRNHGEFIHPERYGQKEKDDEYKGLGEYGWSGQMQQDPVDISGGIIKRKWFRVEDISHLDKSTFKDTLISVDATFKGTKKSDYVVLEYWARAEKDIVLIDAIRGKWDFPKTLQMLKHFHEKHDPKKTIIEDKANGSAIISVIKKHVRGLIAINPVDSKESRVQAVAYLWECGDIVINKELDLLDEFIDEVITFPKATNDDLVDSMSQAVSYLSKPTKKFTIGY